MPVAAIKTNSMALQVQPHMGKKLGSYAKELYNYDLTSKTTTTALEILNSPENDVVKARFILANIKATISNLSAFVKEIHQRKFNDNQDIESIKGNVGLMVATAMFVTMIYCSQLRKATVLAMPVFTDIYDLAASVFERDIWKGLEALEKIIDAALGADSKSLLAITDGSEIKESEDTEEKTDVEPKAKDIEESKDIEFVKEFKELEILVIQVDVPQDEPREDQL